MLITRECDYGVRVVRALAEGEKLSVGSICTAEYIPQPYAYKILKKLEKAGMVRSYRGPAGGYQLAKPPTDITLFDIVAAIEEEVFINSCLQEGFECPHNCEDSACNVHQELRRVQQELVENLQTRSMAQIMAGD